MRRREEEARRRAEEDARRLAGEEEERKKAEQLRQEQEERPAGEPQTREDPDIELIAEGTLDRNLPVLGEDNEERKQLNREEELQKKFDVDHLGPPSEAGSQTNKEEEQKPSDLEGTAFTGEANKNSTTSAEEAGQKETQFHPVIRRPSAQSQEKREQRRRRGLEHNQRETERVASTSSSAAGQDQTSSKSKTQETSGPKERSESKELDQYTFVAWKIKEDKGSKKEPKPPSTGPVRPSSLPLQPADLEGEPGDGLGAVNLHRRPGAIKEKPEKWRGRRSNGEIVPETSSPPPPNKDERMKDAPGYVCCYRSSHLLRINQPNRILLTIICLYLQKQNSIFFI